MFNIDRDTQTIYITRGDIGNIEVTARNNNSKYTFAAGDVIRFKVTDKSKCNCIKIVKDIVVTEPTQTVIIPLESEDTKLDESINKEKEYWYEVELNPDTAPQTIIGYDSKGAKKFVLYPESESEGGDLDE